MGIFRSKNERGRHRLDDPAGSDVRGQQPAPQPYSDPWPPAPAADIPAPAPSHFDVAGYVDISRYGSPTRERGIPAPARRDLDELMAAPGDPPPRPLTGLPLDDALYTLQRIHHLVWSDPDDEVVIAAVRDAVSRWYDRHVR